MCRDKVMLPLAQNESEVSVICSKRGWTGEKAEGEMFLLKGCCSAGLRAECEGSTHAGCERSSAPCSSFQLPAQWLSRRSTVKHGCGEVSFDEYSGAHPAPKVEGILPFYHCRVILRWFCEKEPSSVMRRTVLLEKPF